MGVTYIREDRLSTVFLLDLYYFRTIRINFERLETLTHVIKRKEKKN